jgi:hypothetical protein
MVLDYPFVWPLWNAAENSQRQVCKPVEQGLAFVNFGPGYRVYFGKEGEQTVILLGVAQNNANITTSSLHSNGGKTTSRERSSRKKQKRSEHGFDERF